MSNTIFELNAPINAVAKVPGDKSISHRAVIIGSIAEGRTHVYDFQPGEDCLSTLRIMRQLGVVIKEINPTELVIYGRGLRGLSEPETVCNAGNSGTSMRLLAGVLAGQSFYSVLSGDESLCRRPMARIVEPLSVMGANVWGREDGKYAPLSIRGAQSLSASSHLLPVASAQVKSALLLAGLYTRGKTKVTEPGTSRDHTERMLEQFGARIERQGRTTTLMGGSSLFGTDVYVPGDFSCAAFLIALTLLVSESKITLENVGLNPTRTGLLQVLERMDANITVFDKRTVSGEDVGEISVTYSNLKATTVEAEEVPSMIDEIPILAILASAADGVTMIEGLAELRHKETDRLSAIVEELKRAGVAARTEGDTLIIDGKGGVPQEEGIVFRSYGDHRMAMSMAIMAIAMGNGNGVEDLCVADISFPGFIELLERLGVRQSTNE